MIVILTSRSDVHADELIRLASSKNVEIFRLNTEDLLNDYLISINIASDGLPTGFIEDVVGRRLDLNSRNVAWYRKPSFEFLCPRIDKKFFTLVQAEARATLEVLYRWPSLYWVNCPMKSSAAKSKIQQLIFAGERNILVPPTTITNISSNFIEFCETQNWQVVTKAIYSGNIDIDGLSAAIPTTEISHEEARIFGNRVSLCPTQFQKEIKKLFELRVTAIGNTIFAIKIESQSSDLTRVDWRPYVDLCQHSIFELPKKIQNFCISFLKEFGLEFGAFDFIVDDKGEYIFLECNPFGQYLWTEYETGAKITEAVLKHLISIDKANN